MTMQNYRFSMEKVLEWRMDLEDSAQRVVKEKEDNVMAEQARLDGLISESRKLKSDNLFHSAIGDLKRHSLYKDLLDDKIVRQRLTLEKAKKAVSLAREDLKEAHKDKKVMQKLNDKEKTHYKAFMDKKEQEQLDEISTLSFGRSSAF